MNPKANWRFAARSVTAVLLFGLGSASALFALSLSRPATNPFSGSAAEFQEAAWTSVVLSGALLGVAALLVPTPQRGRGLWRVAWALVGVLHLGSGLAALIGATASSPPPAMEAGAESIRRFLVSFGVACSALGTACLSWVWLCRRSSER